MFYIYICEGIFLFDMLLTFIVDYPQSSSALEKKSVRNFHKIFWRYIKGDFFTNLIAILPFFWFSFPNGSESVFFMLKLSGRLRRGLDYLDIYKIMTVYQLN
jgi:hypothetical protein